jgi:dTDP-4-dehydrorhamnose reductase
VTRILLTGANGQVGYELAPLLHSLGTVVAADRASLDLADADAIVAKVRETAPDIIVNAGAYTAVDLAERERDLAFAINARAPAVLAEEAKRCGALLVHYSTDYVFDGAARVPSREDAPTSPLSVYGASKLEGERAIAASGAKALVFRTSWVYALRGRNFVLTMRRLAAEREELRVVDDQVGVPNWSRALARATVRVLSRRDVTDRAGLYHLSSTGDATWFAFARAIIGDVARPRLVPIATADYPTPARRPAYGVLDTTRFADTFGFSLPPWRDAFAECLASAVAPAGHVVH